VGGASDTELIRAWQEDGDSTARAVLVERLLPLAQGLARRYAGRGEPLDDLEQVACVGLLKAIDRFDPSRDVRFATFAVPTIAGEIKRHFRDKGWMLRVPREVQELHARLAAARDALTAQHGRSPTIRELAAAAGATEDQVVEALGAAGAYRLASLDAPASADGPEVVGDGVADQEDGFAAAERRMLVGGGLRHLAPREREIVRLRFFEGLTQREIAREVGISQMHVSRLLRRAVEGLRDVMERDALAA
jgi:RNA polymerase sigma-B factor